MAFNRQPGPHGDSLPPATTEDSPQTYSHPVALLYYEIPEELSDSNGVVRFIVDDSEYSPTGMFAQDISLPRRLPGLLELQERLERLDTDSLLPIWESPPRHLYRNSRLASLRSVPPDQPRFRDAWPPRSTVLDYFDDTAARRRSDNGATSTRYGLSGYDTTTTSSHASAGYDPYPCPRILHPPQQPASLSTQRAGILRQTPNRAASNPMHTDRQPQQQGPSPRPHANNAGNYVNYVFDRITPDHNWLCDECEAEAEMYSRTGPAYS